MTDEHRSLETLASQGDGQSEELIRKVQAMLEVESALTASLEKVEPWLLQSSSTRKLTNPHRPRVRPIPTSKEQVEHVLAVARTLSKRTSAPAGWNPNAPVIGFSTPNPLPHQLRGGALATLQLEWARQLEREKKRQRIQEQEESAKASQMELDEDGPSGDQTEEQSNGQARDPKRREVVQHEHQLDRTKSDLARSEAKRMAARKLPPQQLQRPAHLQDVSMNLSDSSSSEEDDDE